MPLFVEQSEEPPPPLESVPRSLEAAAGAQERSVFVSPDGRRARLLRALGRIAALITAAWLVALVAGALGFGRMPGLPLPAIGALAKPTAAPASQAPAAGGVRKRAAPSPPVPPTRPAGQSAARALRQGAPGSGASRRRGGTSSGSRSGAAPSSGAKSSSGRGSGTSATGSGKSPTGTGKAPTGKGGKGKSATGSSSTGTSTSKGTRGAGGAHRSPRAPGPPPVKPGLHGTSSGGSR
ncbi:MAG: hypothetical protein JWN32_1983, partial [Solirubrobacterales bacterium]|nr:hypothetical protein [Solirubrobacterales bacterium]